VARQVLYSGAGRPAGGIEDGAAQRSELIGQGARDGRTDGGRGPAARGSSSSDGRWEALKGERGRL
jgi:hypothetical protein